jgi:hypothetical protein
MSDEMELLIERARATEPKAGVKARLRARVLGAAVGGAALTGAGHTAAASAKWLFGSKAVTLVLCVGGGVALGSLVVAPLLWSGSATAPRPLPAVATSSAVHPVKAPVAAGAAAPAMPESPVLPVRSVAIPRAPTPDAAVPSIERETALLAEAQRALREGNAGAALRVLDRYDREIGQGTMAEEAAAARAVSTCLLTKTRSAAALVTFRAKFPSSPLLTRVQAACSYETSHDDFELDSPTPATNEMRR